MRRPVLTQSRRHHAWCWSRRDLWTHSSQPCSSSRASRPTSLGSVSARPSRLWSAKLVLAGAIRPSTSTTVRNRRRVKATNGRQQGSSVSERASVLRRHGGLFVDYPSDRATRRGSCILIHIWSAPDTGTAGCIGLPEERVRALQDFSRAGAVLAVLPETALERFPRCLPAAIVHTPALTSANR